MGKLKIHLYINLSILTYIVNEIEIKIPHIIFVEQNKQIDSKTQMEEQILKNNKNNSVKEEQERGTCPAIHQGISQCHSN